MDLLFSWVYFITELLADESKHFLLAAVSGLLVCLLTWIILRVVYWGLRHLIHWRGSMAAVWCIRGSSFLAGLCVAVLSHWVLDYWVVLYTMPLGPPLQLIVR
jgi:ABC-type uncharacterized transport system permease subunit